MHRVILGRELGRPLQKRESVDHIDGDGLNNRRVNLRIASVTQNAQNAKLSKRNKVGLKGVSWHQSDRRGQASISVNGRRKFRGYFDTSEEAHAAYCAAADVYHGEFANHG